MPVFHPARRALLAALAALAAGCVSAPRTPARPIDRPYWPRPPDRPRYIHEATLRRPVDLVGDAAPTGLLREMLGPGGIDMPAFEKPAAVVARHGRIYVADSVRRHVVAFDVPRRRVFVLGVRPNGRLAKPAGLALDGRSNVYVADSTARRIQVYDAWGLPLASLGGPESLERPTGVAVDREGGRIYAIDRSHNERDTHRVRIFTREGALAGDIGRRGAGPGEFNIPVAGAVAPDGTLYILDAGNFRVQAFSPRGEFLRAFGRSGAGPGDFARPRAIAVDDEGQVYVSDASFGNVQIFSPEGRLLLAIGRTAKEDGPGRYGLAFGVAVDETGRIYVTDQLFNKLEVVRPLKEAEAQALLDR